jgi:hypothetical protein
VAEIMRAVDEGVRMTRCAGEDAAPCVPGQRCLTHGLWDALGEQIAWFLDSVTLEEVIGGIAPSKFGRRPEAGQEASDASPAAAMLQQEAWREGIAPLSPGDGVAPLRRTDRARIGGQ